MHNRLVVLPMVAMQQKECYMNYSDGWMGAGIWIWIVIGLLVVTAIAIILELRTARELSGVRRPRLTLKRRIPTSSIPGNTNINRRFKWSNTFTAIDKRETLCFITDVAMIPKIGDLC